MSNSVMKAADASKATAAELRFPLIASPKIDGFRCYVDGGRAQLRGAPIPNAASDKFFSRPELEGFDGELVVGSPAGEGVFARTTSGLRRHGGDPKATYLVFDVMGTGYPFGAGLPFSKRVALVESRVAALPPEFAGRVVAVAQVVVKSMEELQAFEAKCVDAGFEGVIVRAPDAVYKYGRSTLRERGMLKIKRFVDAEAVVVGMVEEVDSTGRGKGTMGALVCRALASGVTFNIGTGFTAEQRAAWWSKPNVCGLVVKFKYFPVGTVTAPRHPVFLGQRLLADMDLGDVERASALAA